MNSVKVNANVCAIIDLDGTLCNHEERIHHLKRDDGGKPDWKSFYMNASNDDPIEWCLQVVYGLQAQGIKILFVTGRPEEYRSLTCDWLSDVADLHADDENLFMRKTGDYRPDTVVKTEIYNAKIKDKFDVLLAIEDRKRVVQMWRDLGIVCLTHRDDDF